MISQPQCLLAKQSGSSSPPHHHILHSIGCKKQEIIDNSEKGVAAEE